MSNEQNRNSPSPANTGFGWLKLSAIIVAATVVSTLLAVWAITTYVFPREFTPVELNEKEWRALDDKLSRLDALDERNSRRQGHSGTGRDAGLEPEPYTEENASREIVLSERELNALLARNTDLARTLVIDLSDDLASGKLLIPLDEDFPVLGGKTLKVTAGLNLAYAGGKPVVMLKGVSIWGVPLPNAWLGNLKNVDLIREFGDEGGFWGAFAAGVDEIRVHEGQLLLRLKE